MFSFLLAGLLSRFGQLSASHLLYPGRASTLVLLIEPLHKRA